MKRINGAGNLVILGVVTSCAAPAITLNVWPRVESMMSSGIKSNELGIALLVGVSALAMTTIPFAMLKAPNRGFWWTSLAFGIFLAILNYVMAVGAVGKISDHATAEATALLSKAQSLKDQLQELQSARRELGSFKPATEAMLRAADEAVRLAEDAKRQECDKVGDHCRARVAQLQTRLTERNETALGVSLSAKALELERGILSTRAALNASGTLPISANPQAERIRSVVAMVYPNAATESVATGIIHFLAIAAEAFALLAPRVVMTALGSKVELPLRGGTLSAPGPLPLPPARRALAAKSTAALPPPPAIAPAPVRAWKDTHLKRGKKKLGSWPVYQTYVKWCKASNLKPATFTQFDFELCEAGVKKATEGHNTFYLEIDL